MLNVRLAGGHLYGKQLFNWLSLVVSFMASFVLSFYPRDVLVEIWDVIESVSKRFLTYSFSTMSSVKKSYIYIYIYIYIIIYRKDVDVVLWANLVRAGPQRTSMNTI